MTVNYIDVNSLGSCNARSQGSGLFVPGFKTPTPSPWLLGSVSGRQIAVFLGAGEKQFYFSDLSAAQYELPGVMYPDPTILVVEESAFWDIRAGEPGDLIFNAGVASIVATELNGARGFDEQQIAFDEAPSTFLRSVGFKDWQLALTGEAGNHVLWQRTVA